MIHLEISTLIRAPKAKIFQIIKDPHKLLRFAKGVESVEVLEKEDHRLLIRFQGRWGWLHLDSTHEAVFKPPDELRFFQVRGDFEHLEGNYTLQEGPDGTTVTYAVSFGLGIPFLGDLVGKVWVKRMMRTMAEELLEGIRQEAENTGRRKP
ncbi:MAG: SRPBCC family protein [candidate division NC10 bacterium]|nr:SRPBCC family protein [candidate division NC10 bacterium]